jgi:hypothetical protein
MTQKALINGITGQDGSHPAEHRWVSFTRFIRASLFRPDLLAKGKGE